MDLHNNIDLKRGLSPVAAGTNNTAYVSEIVDRAGYDAVEFAILIGANTDSDATFTVLFEDGDNNALSDNAAVADTFLLGTETLASFNYGDDNEVRKIGYTGTKRYCRVTITPSGNDSGNIYIAGIWILGGMRHAPASNPPA